jgi:hypothetical protein
MNMNQEKYGILRPIALFIAGLAFISITISTLLLEFTHGDVTPRGNRYCSTSFFSFDWLILVLTFVTYLLLLLPWLKYAIKKNRDIFSIGIFPATNLFAKICSVLLTLLSVVTGGLYTLAHLGYSIHNVMTGAIILAEDRLMMIFAYSTGIVFWFIVCAIYKITYRKW